MMNHWNNAVESQGLYQRDDLAGDMYRGWMTLKNVWVPIKLGLNMFHPVHILGMNLAEHLKIATDYMKVGDMNGALKAAAEVFNLKPKAGTDLMAAWKKPDSEWTPWEREQMGYLKEAGVVPQQSEELRIQAKDALAKATANGQWIKALPLQARRAIEVAQAPIFEKWIPSLKVNAVLKEVQSLFKRQPDMMNNPERHLERATAMREIGKSIDNRFGEMFYGGLHWNRYVKDVGVGSFISLSWNLGWMREAFGGLALEPLRIAGILKRNPLMQSDVSGRMAFSLIYASTAMLITGMMTKLLSGKDPEDINDYIFPWTGEMNPDGTKYRMQTPFFTREIPQFIKHKEDQQSWAGGAMSMLWNKMIYSPIIEAMQNRTYFGYDITDPNASEAQHVLDYLKFFGGQFIPISGTQIQRIGETTNSPRDIALSLAGFGPAPSYASRTDTQNLINYLYERHVAPLSRSMPLEATNEMRKQVKSEFMQAIQSGDTQGMEDAVTRGAQAGLKATDFKRMRIPGDIVLFKALPEPDQLAVLSKSGHDEMMRYWLAASQKTKLAAIQAGIFKP
jgi:hypothetical protein